MRFNLKIINWIISLWLVIVLFKFELIIDYISLVISYLGLLIYDFGDGISVLNFALLDVIFSTLLFLLFIPLMLIFTKRLSFLKTKLNFSGLIGELDEGVITLVNVIIKDFNLHLLMFSTISLIIGGLFLAISSYLYKKTYNQ